MGNSHSTKTNIQALPAQIWSHVALTWDGTGYTVYVNGVSKATGTFTGLSDLAGTAHIGNNGYSSATEAFSGRIDEARLYNRSLSAPEIQTIYAFAPSGTFTVTSGVSGGNGTITPSGSSSVISGSSKSFTAAPSTGYVVDVWKVDGITVQTGGTTYTLSNITAGHTLTVQFKAQTSTTYTITASSAGNGTISPSGAITVNSGSNQQFTASPSNGYIVDIWKLDGTTVQTAGTIYTLGNITAAHTVTVQFKLGTSSGPVGYWKFDETSGTTASDSSGSNNNATLLNSAAFVSGGKFGGAVDLVSEVSDAVQVSMDNCSAASGTVAMWVYSAAFTAAPQYLFGHATAPWANRIQLYIPDSTGNLALGIGTSHMTKTGIQTLAAQTWYHIALTWNADNYVVYVNGVAKANGTYTGLSALNTVAHLGNDGYETDTNEAFNGRIDEARLYNRALTGAEVQTLYASTTNSTPVFNTVNNQSVLAGSLCSFTVSATDADGDPITYSASNLPPGAAFNASTKTFTWTPLLAQAGTYTVTFSASDGKLTTLKTVNISVYAQDADANDTLVLNMTLNDTPSDGVSDSSHSKNDGIASGMPTLVTGKFNKGYSFDGLADYVTIPDSPSLDCNYITLAAWVDPNAYVARQRVISKEIGSGAPSTVYALRFSESDPTKLEFWFTVGNVEYTVTSKTSIPLNKWTHVAATYDRSTAVLYVNGNADTTELDIPGEIIINANPVYIGGSQFAPDFFHGILDEVLIYNDALSATEVQGLLLAANAPPIIDPIANKTATEGQNLSFVISATDPDGDTLTYSAKNLPAGATFNAATKTFSWTPSDSQAGTYSVTFTATDGELEDDKIVNITVGDVTAAGFRDDFTASPLNTGIWTFTNPLNDATQSIISGLLKFTLPANKLHDISASTNSLPRIMTPVNNTDFTIEAKFTSELQKNQLQGLLVQQDSKNTIRFEIWSNGSSARWYVESWVNGAAVLTLDKNFSFKAPYYVRIVRTGNVFGFYYSANGTNWIAAASTTRIMTPSSVGVYGGNAGTASATFTTLVDYFSKK